jgi:hypothetical protein
MGTDTVVPCTAFKKCISQGKRCQSGIIREQKTGEQLEKSFSGASAKKSMRLDLNQRPLRPERSALPN